MGAPIDNLDAAVLTGAIIQPNSLDFYGVFGDTDYRMDLNTWRNCMGMNIGALVTTSTHQGVTTATDPYDVSWTGVVYGSEWRNVNSPTGLIVPNGNITHVRIQTNMQITGGTATVQIRPEINGANVYPLPICAEKLNGTKYIGYTSPAIPVSSGDYITSLLAFVTGTSTIGMGQFTWFSVTPVRFA